jgi:hypothetical protein
LAICSDPRFSCGRPRIDCAAETLLAIAALGWLFVSRGELSGKLFLAARGFFNNDDPFAGDVTQPDIGMSVVRKFVLFVMGSLRPILPEPGGECPMPFCW